MPNTYDLSVFEDGLKELNIQLSEQQMQQFICYYEMLVEWNKVMNLTGITEWDEVVLRHFLDSLSIAKVCDMEKIETVIDVGTGAGFPGIPLLIAFPHLKITLLDSLKKRIGFLDAVIEKTGLEGAKTIHGRAEDFAKQADYRENYQLCVSRAVADLRTLSEYCLPFVDKSGKLISYKSGKIEEEMEYSKKAISILGGKLTACEKFMLANTDIERSFIIIEKTKNTPKKYPRKAGLPSKEPL